MNPLDKDNMTEQDFQEMMAEYSAYEDAQGYDPADDPRNREYWDERES